jgi:hypothetical protein
MTLGAHAPRVFCQAAGALGIHLVIGEFFYALFCDGRAWRFDMNFTFYPN